MSEQYYNVPRFLEALIKTPYGAYASGITISGKNIIQD